MMERRLISVKGIVQGVGFRPYIYRLASENGLKGCIVNTPDGVEIDVEGDSRDIDKFCETIKVSPPPLASIETVEFNPMAPVGYKSFTIGVTQRDSGANAFVAFDVAVCDDCLTELFDPEDRRYSYPFINCTNCGPRFTIIKDVPYDREFTTMNVFPMCQHCSLEYSDPANRRFHAQPNACPVCGPKVELRDSSGGLVDKQDALKKAANFLKEGSILAIKGLGGYHLSCNARDENAVSTMRRRKVREDKPFAVMAGSLEQVKTFCHVSHKEAEILSSPARPIVLLRKKEEQLASQLAPGNAYLGVMLPYTPLHYIIFKNIDFPLVMTSGNISDEPIAYKDEDAFMRLGEIADYFLTHNREIWHRCDDSVTRVYDNSEYLIRRSRGYSPAPIRLNTADASILAVGGEQKNTFCLTKGGYAFLSHHIGDLENIETLTAFHHEINLYKKLFDIEPQIVAYDYHPEYLSTKYAIDIPGLLKVGVQHHHAHIAACMAENGLDGSVLGVSFDGTGFGPDGSIWGGEFLHASLNDFKRFGHLKYVPMPGGSRAVKEPWRMAAGFLYNNYGSEWRSKSAGFLKRKNGMLLDALEEIMEKRINCPPTSSMGRLFDAVAALIDIKDEVNYEGQAAVEMEQEALRAGNIKDQAYNYVIRQDVQAYEIDTGPIIEGVLNDLSIRQSKTVMSYKFHDTVKNIVVDMCRRGREELGENRVCLSGGVFQNLLLLDMTYRGLKDNGFEVYLHRKVPPNDGNISLGQAAIAEEKRRLGSI